VTTDVVVVGSVVVSVVDVVMVLAGDSVVVSVEGEVVVLVEGEVVVLAQGEVVVLVEDPVVDPVAVSVGWFGIVLSADCCSLVPDKQPAMVTVLSIVPTVQRHFRLRITII
jgi:hypothetical protein